MTKTKMYKPGQLLTIDGKVYRIKRNKSYHLTCTMCNARQLCLKSGREDRLRLLFYAIPINCYLQLVKPKRSNYGKD